MLYTYNLYHNFWSNSESR